MSNTAIEQGPIFEVFFEGECGMESALIVAADAAAFMKKLRATYPDDIGADGFFIDPHTGEERPLNW